MTTIRQITDPEVQALASIAAILKSDYVKEGQDDPWAGKSVCVDSYSPFTTGWQIGEQLVAGWCAAKGLDVTASHDSEADRIIGGHRVEIKFSTLWESGVYKFQQVRDQNYAYVICLGLSPFDAHCWVVSKDLLRVHVLGHTPQHAGKAGTDTFWLSFPATNPASWLSPCGGTLAQAFDALKRIGRSRS